MRLWRLTVSCKEKTFGLIIIYSTSCRNSCRFHVHVYIHDKTTLKSGTFRVNWSSCKTLNLGADLPAQFWNLPAPPFTLRATEKHVGFNPWKIFPHWEMLPNSAKKLVVRNGGILYGPKKATFLDGSRFMGSHPSIHTTSWAMSLALTVVNLPFKGRFFLGEEPSRPWVYVHMTHNIWPCFVIAWTKESSLFYILGHFASREFIVFISKDAFYLFRADSPKSATESPVADEIENSNSKNHPGSSVILEN